MLHYNKPVYGHIWYKDNYSDKEHKVTIFSANALCAMVEITPIPAEERENPAEKFYHNLFGFFADEQHIKNVMKADKEALPLLGGKVTRIELNLAYKESWTLLKYFVKSNYKCKVFYKEEKA
jgi:hypothetical protein